MDKIIQVIINENKIYGLSELGILYQLNDREDISAYWHRKVKSPQAPSPHDGKEQGK